MICLGAAPAKSQPLTYVSGKGTDKGDCSPPASPCRTFQYAANQTAPSGEVKALDPANYFSVTITKSISLTGVEGAGIDANGGTAITINSAGSTISLANLLIQNQSVSNPRSTGIGGGGAALLTVKQCAIQGFVTGIGVQDTAVLLADTFVTNNQNGIILYRSLGGTLDHVTASFNKNVGVGINVGVGAVGGASLFPPRVAVIDTVANGNGTGFDLGPFATVLLARSTVIGNQAGIKFEPVSHEGGAFAESFGDNHIRGNGTDVQGGTLTSVGTQ
jgi:hypothetical protein